MTFTTSQVLTASQLNDFRPGNRVRVPVGTRTVPTYSFLTDTDTGMFRPGSNLIGFATSGIERLRITDSSVAMDGTRLGFGDVTTTANDVIIKTTASQYRFRQDGIDTMQIDPDAGGIGLRGTRIRINGIASNDYIEWDTTTSFFEVPGMAIFVNGDRVWKGFRVGNKTRWMFSDEPNDFIEYDKDTERFVVTIQNDTKFELRSDAVFFSEIYDDLTTAAPNLNVAPDGRIRRSTA